MMEHISFLFSGAGGTVPTFCEDHEKAGFIAGIKIGMSLAKEMCMIKVSYRGNGKDTNCLGSRWFR